MWDNTDYWKDRFTSKEVFLNYVANNANNGPDFLQGQMDNYFGSSEFKEWHTQWKQEHANDPYIDSTDDSVFQEFNLYCQTHDCDGILIDSIGTLGAIGVAAACVPGFAICGAAMTVGTPIALVTGGVGVVRTAALTADGKATQEDLMVSTATFVIGTIGPFGRTIGPATSAVVGLGSAGIQMGWDFVGSMLNAGRYPPYNE